MTLDSLIEKHMGLVYACARRFNGKGVEYEDLCSAGTVGLIKAVDRFDESLGYRFSTYAVPLILGEMRMLFREGGSVKLTRSLQELSMKARRICDAYKDKTGFDIGITALAEQLGTDVYRAQEALNAARSVLSLSYASQDGEDESLEIPIPSAEEAVTEHLSLEQALDSLNDEERELIRLRYYQHKTQSATAAVMHTTQVQISRREKKILLKMRMMLL